MQLEFAKYEGAGNDFILIDAREHTFIPESKLVARLCDRHFGIGADGLMILSRSESYDCSMHYYNADGSAGEMCGNGGRCFALFARHLGIVADTLRFDSLDGGHTAHMLSSGLFSGTVELGMVDVQRITATDDGWVLNTGVPHYVEFTDDIDSIDVTSRGRALRSDIARFPQGTNVNFVQVTGPGTLRIRTYERGVEAETLACGTGATAAALVTNFVLQPNVCNFNVSAQGGMLRIAFERSDFTSGYQHIHLSGEARRVFGGEIDTENL